jgi:RecA-family ATPase
MQLPSIPRDTRRWLESGATEGERNAELMKHACQMRDAKWPRDVVEDFCTRRAKFDGLSDSEIRNTLRSVYSRPPRQDINDGYSPMPRPKLASNSYHWETEEPSKPKVYALDEADELPEPISEPEIAFLENLYDPDDKIQVVVGRKDEDGGSEVPTGTGTIMRRDDWIEKIKDKGSISNLFNAADENGKIHQGLYFAINPLITVADGRKKKNIAKYKYALVEFDTISLKQQWQLLKKSKIPCATICYSGNKSLHALIKVNAKDQGEYDERVTYILNHFSEYDVDTQNKDPSRLSRFPGCTRGDTLLDQTLLAVNTGLPSWRDWINHQVDDFPDIMTQEDFYARDLSEPPSIIEGLLHRQLSLVIGGSSKTYKSWTLLDMAVSVANGSDFWGMKTTKGKVLYINFEIPEYYMRERVKAVSKAKDISLPSDNLYIWNLRGRAQALENIRPTFTKVMANANFSMVILDPIYKTLGDRDENAAGDINSLMNEMEHLALETGAAVVFATHFSKGNQASKSPIDRISGSGVFARSPDTILVMTEHEEDGCYTVDSTVRNFDTPRPFVVKMNFPLFTRTESLDPQKLKRPGGRPQAEDCVPDVIDYLKAVKSKSSYDKDWWVPLSDIVQNMTEAGHSPSTVKRQITKAVKDGKIARESSPGKKTKLRALDFTTYVKE